MSIENEMEDNILHEEIVNHLTNMRKDLDDLERLILSGRSTIFKDKSVLDFSNVYDDTLVREKYLGDLNRLFEPLLNYNKSIYAIITGKQNSGKLATINKCISGLRKTNNANNTIEVVHVNCRRRKTDAGIMLKVIQHFQPSFPDRDFSVDEMKDSLKKHLDEQNTHLIIILEEIDILLEGRQLDFLYHFVPSNNKLSWMDGKVSMIGVSNRTYSEFKKLNLPQAINNLQLIEFQTYTSVEIRSILGQCVETAFKKDIVNSDVIELIADITSKDGDIRLAIELLHKAGIDAEIRGQNEVTIKNVSYTNQVLPLSKNH